MNSFANPGYSNKHSGAVRLAAATTAIWRVAGQFRGAKGLVAMLLAAAMSALVVVADQVVNTWTEGNQLLAWITLWALVFAAVALFSEVTRGWTVRVIAALEARSKAAAERAEDERVWAVAQSDPRFMADIQAARLRAERDALAAGEPLPSWPFADLPMHHIVPRPWS